MRGKLGVIGLCLTACVLLLSLMGQIQAAGPADPWTAQGHDAQRSGRSAGWGPITANIKWFYDLGARSQDNASPIVGSDGTIYVSSQTDFFAINPNGTLKWKKTYELGTSWGMRNAASLSPDGSTVYVLSGWLDSSLTALSSSDGSISWQYLLDGQITYSSMVVGADGVIYIGTWKPALYAVNPNGTLKWRYDSPSACAIESPPAVDTMGNVYFAHNCVGLVALNSSGILRWTDDRVGTSFDWPTPILGSDGTIYIDRFVFNSNGTLKWERDELPIRSYMYGASLAADGSTLYLAIDGSIYALNAVTGATLWTNTIATADETFGGTPALSGNGVFYVMGNRPSGNDYVYAVSAHDGTLLWQYQLNSEAHFWSPQSPAIGIDGTLYVLSSGDLGISGGTTSARLYAFNPTVDAESSLSIAQSDVPDPVGVGNDVTYTLTVTNDGPNPATGVVVTDILPADMSFVSSTPGAPTCTHTSGIVTCNLGTLGAGLSIQVSIVANATAVGTATNKAHVIANVTDPNLNDNITQAAILVKIPPATPVLLTPLPGSTTTNQQPAFTWGAVAGAARYEMRLGTSNPPDVVVSNSSARNFTPVNPLLISTYYWQVRAVDIDNLASGWSAPFNLTILSAPNAAPIRNYYTTATPTLTWAWVSWATGYEIQVDTSSSFTVPLDFTATLGADMLRVSASALGEGTYYWRVRAKKPDGTWGGWSAVETFVVDLP